MYITTDDAMPVGNLKGLIAFEQKIEVPGAKAGNEFELEAGIEQLGALLVDNTQVEIKAVINLNLIAFEDRRVRKLADIEAEELTERFIRGDISRRTEFRRIAEKTGDCWLYRESGRLPLEYCQGKPYDNCGFDADKSACIRRNPNRRQITHCKDGLMCATI